MATLEVVDPSILYAMFKGEPGTRKSTQALSFPKPQYWFSWDRKMSGLIVPARQWGIDLKQIEYDDYEDWTKARAKLEKFQLNCPFKTLAFDSVTSCADMSIRQVMKIKGGGKDGKGKMIGGISVAGLEEFNAEAAALQELISLTKDIHSYHKVNIILIAHVIQAEYRSIGGETHMSRTIVTAAKRVAAKIPAYCQEVYHFNIKRGFEADASGRYALLTEHTGDDFARTSLGLDREIVFDNNPIYERWILPAIEKLKANPQTVVKV